MTETSAVVIFTRSLGPAFAGIAPGGCKGLIEVAGRPAAAHLLDRLRECEMVSRVLVVGDSEVADATPNADEHIAAGSTDGESVIAGIRAADGAGRCLVMTADMPIVPAEALADLLIHAPEADIVYPVATRADVEQVFGSRSTSYMKTTDGEVTGSGLILVRRETAVREERILTGLLEARRNPTALLGLIGPWVAMRIMISTPSLAEMEGHLSKGLGLACRVFVTHYPEMLFALDSPEDVALAERHVTL